MTLRLVIHCRREKSWPSPTKYSTLLAGSHRSDSTDTQIHLEGVVEREAQLGRACVKGSKQKVSNLVGSSLITERDQDSSVDIWIVERYYVISYVC